MQQINYWCSKTDGKGRYAGIRSWTLYSNCCCFATNIWNRNILSVIKAYLECVKYLTDINNITYYNIYKRFTIHIIFNGMIFMRAIESNCIKQPSGNVLNEFVIWYLSLLLLISSLLTTGNNRMNKQTNKEN